MEPGIYAVICDSSSEEEEEMELCQPTKLPLAFVTAEPEYADEEIIAASIQPIINGVQRIKRAKVVNYIDTTVQTYLDDDFIMHFRLSRRLAYQLVNRFAESHIYTSLNSTCGKMPLTPECHILVFLWFAGHESCYRDVADRFGITISSLYVVITRVADFLRSLAPEVIRLPNEDEKQEIETYFRVQKKFPGVIGALDGTHIEILKPRVDGVSYYTRKKRFAIQAQGLVNHEKKFCDVFVGYPGSVHDSRILRSSDVFPLLPALCGNNYHILADTAYALSKEIITPFKDYGHLNVRQKYFNKTLSSCRVVVEHAFGEMKQRFRQLYYCELTSMERIVKLVYACCVLHNLADANDLRLFEEPRDCENAGDAEVIVNEGDVNALANRQQLVDTVWAMRH